MRFRPPPPLIPKLPLPSYPLPVFSCPCPVHHHRWTLPPNFCSFPSLVLAVEGELNSGWLTKFRLWLLGGAGAPNASKNPWKMGGLTPKRQRIQQKILKLCSSLCSLDKIEMVLGVFYKNIKKSKLFVQLANLSFERETSSLADPSNSMTTFPLSPLAVRFLQGDDRRSSFDVVGEKNSYIIACFFPQNDAQECNFVVLGAGGRLKTTWWSLPLLNV